MTIEQEIQAKGLTAPRITPADIEANIASEHYFTAADGALGAHRNGRIFAADRENLTIAHVARSADGDYSPANGDVLAAAPDLLSALIEIRAYLSKCPPHAEDITGAKWGRVMDLSGVALNKAEGTS